ncbi:hypothetical protein COCSADRAFT_285327 [Bipolaris sorokiniana ND90Pr]|uniref:Uncharacterized protein n=1 Tax=Cochliobolus sativus (strain ND90Pr / ATCC 201652) TaxID=665912 RepID=M2TD29_COCSN|nr:uncharacterized protein COCSADRAFT_285327 [Bipolaris sorokiniana ND90Pr]EMD67151.1 hypothetical protein COCSADRAFT_285327 [Bipolaris sorokiniana ND90Pr]
MTRHCQGGSHVTSPPYPGAWLPISYRPCCPIFCATLHSTGLYWVGGCDRLLLPLYLALVSNQYCEKCRMLTWYYTKGGQFALHPTLDNSCHKCANIWLLWTY